MSVSADAVATEGEARPRAVGRPYVLLEDAVDAFVERPVALHTAGEIGDQIVHLAWCADRLRLTQARLVSIFDGTGEAEAQGSNDTVDWVRHHANLSVAESYSLRAVGPQVEQIPAAVIALEKGELGFGHLLHMAHTAAFCARTKNAGAFDEAPLVKRAREESVSRFRETCKQFQHIQNPDGVKDDEVDAFEARKLTFNATDDGRYYVNVELDPVGYTTVRTALEARGGRDGREDPRKRDRRLADGFIDMCMDDMARSAKPGESLAPVHISISCSCDTFLSLPGSPGAVTEYGALLSSAAVGRLACDAAITHIKLDGASYFPSASARSNAASASVRCGPCVISTPAARILAAAAPHPSAMPITSPRGHRAARPSSKT